MAFDKPTRPISLYAISATLLFALSLLFVFNSKQKIDFNADVRPILNQHCLGCHGGVKQSGGLSFLFESMAFEPAESGHPAIVRFHPEDSELFKRISHNDPEQRMPPEADPLSKEEINTLKRWIKQGATWKDHWAYVAPQRPPVPKQTSTKDFIPQKPIDHFILAKLAEQKLMPSPQADKTTLLRRLSLDLIGLPPTTDEIALFLADTTAAAYEKQVDRLLASPRYGERWTAVWMDLARYGDSQGYQKDPYRSIWRYRDWLIDAFNEDMPFSQFTVEQLAGDLMPDSTESTLLATAFHRNTMTNDEGGTDDEEFRVAAVLDRVSTTWEVWQGTTMACVQCHSHPYDPFIQEDFYNLYAFFNNTQDSDKGNDRPRLFTYSKADKALIRKYAENLQETTAIAEITASWQLDSIRQELINFIEQQPLVKKQAMVAAKDSLESLRMVPTPIMQDLPTDKSRTTYLFERGNWLVHGKEVHPDVPASMPPLLEQDSFSRLDLAQWLVNEENPLTARVTVNRFWAKLFGRGIVETLEDFGSQGSKPTHPALLDWLAVHFKDDLNWSVKGLLKEMVMSATYQQNSSASPKQIDIDPGNRWLARGPRVRLSAEQVRDQALAVSGLLSDKMHGPSVMPPQPDGVWQVIRQVLRWRESPGEDRYRRAIYTFWRKSSPYPSFLTFDSPSRELCVSRRINTNTPLQALITLNDTVFVEAAQKMAFDLYQLNEIDECNKISQIYEKAMLRPPPENTLNVLWKTFQDTKMYYQGRPEEASTLAGHGVPKQADLAALTVTANVVLNLDEFLNRE